MTTTIVIICLILSVLILLALVYDLYGRTGALAQMDAEQRKALQHHHWLLSQVTRK
jgi:hypothetical protein